MMRRYIIILTAALLCLTTSAFAGDRLREKVYVTTDKGVYVSGDALWISAYCMDLNTGRLSDFSKVAYVELVSPSGVVQTGKVALLDGRGAGRITLANTLPTGNYSLIAYTAQSRNEKGFNYASDPRNITILNTFSTERQPESVEVADEVTAESSEKQTGSLTLSCSGEAGRNNTIPVRITNNGSKSVSFNFSVYHDDGIPSPESGDMSSFLKTVSGAGEAEGFTDTVTPEYEGEIIHAHVSGSEEARQAAIGKFAFISVPGSQRNVYTSRIGEDGKIDFYTSNIYGDNDMFLEIEGMPEDKICHLEVDSPFVGASVSNIPALKISSAWGDKLKLRSMGMQISKAFDADTLYEYLPHNDHDVLGTHHIRYNLDDYTRFPVMEEVFTEFIGELRSRKVDGKKDIQVRVEDNYNDYFFPSGSSLMLLDGVPVLDQQKIIDYDPLLVNYIDIFPYTYYLGIRGFQGVVNFVTYKQSLPSMTFADNVRIVSNQGTAFPMAFTGNGTGSTYPDYRQTICWEPLLTLEPGESIEINVKTPAYGGRFEAKVEGLSAESEAALSRTGFEVR